jgi:hypothetical protein
MNPTLTMMSLPSSQGPKKEPPTKTLRFNIPLLDKVTTEFDFRELTKKGPEYVSNQIQQLLPPEEIFPDMSSQSSQLSDQEHVYLEEYDLDDPFIDDSEVLEVTSSL